MALVALPRSSSKEHKVNIETSLHPDFGLPVHYGELWTARQRQMHPVHYTVSYRASFKPELPDFFMRRFLPQNGGGLVLDPFGGRGTTVLQANLLGHKGIHNDRNPVSLYLIRSRQQILSFETLAEKLAELNLEKGPVNILAADRKRLTPFFHERTLKEIVRLRALIQADSEMQDAALNYIGVTALSRLHGHSGGFFSVYSFPQISIMPQAQARNNRNRGQIPEYRAIRERILRKMKTDLSRPLPEHFCRMAMKNRYLREDARQLKGLRKNSVDLVITSPPFLNKVNYFDDNWMRAWFLGCEESFNRNDLTVTPDLKKWSIFMRDVMFELGRVLKPGAHAVIEVGEVVLGGRSLNLDEILLEHLPLSVPGGRLLGREVFINAQNFTKLANCWDVKNNKKGTNTNRCLVLQKSC